MDFNTVFALALHVISSETLTSIIVLVDYTILVFILILGYMCLLGKRQTNHIIKYAI